MAKKKLIDDSDVRIAQDYTDLLKSQTKELSFQKTLSSDIRNASKGLYSLTQDLLTLDQESLGTKKETEEILKKIAKSEDLIKKIETSRRIISKDNTALSGEMARNIAAQVKQSKEFLSTLKSEAEVSSKVSENFSVKAFSGLAEISNKYLGKNFSGAFEKGADAARKVTLEGAKNGQFLKEAMESGRGLTKAKIKELGLEKKLGNLTGKFAAQKLKGLKGDKQVSKLLKGNVGSMKGLSAGMGATLKSLSASLGPMSVLFFMIDGIVKAIGEMDKLQKSITESQGIGVEEATAQVERAHKIAHEQGIIGVHTKDIVAANIELNKLFGTSVEMSGDLAAEFSEIQKRTGLSADAMGFYAKGAVASGKTIKEQLTDVTITTLELNKQTGLNLNLKEIQEGVASASAATKLSMGGSVQELTKAVFRAKQFGLNMDQLDNAAGSLLDFESSIAAELEAELLTGKELSLEKARQAALDNDMATLASEIAKNVGSAAEFSEMNRFQQEAIAKSVGMSREDLAKTLTEQEHLNKLKEKGFATESEAQDKYNSLIDKGLTHEQAISEIGDKELANQFKSIRQQEKFAELTAQIQEIFLQMAPAVMDFITPIADVLLPVVEGIAWFFGGIFNTFTMLGELISPIIEKMGVLGKVIKGVAGVAIIFAAYKTFGAVATALAATVFGGLAAPIVGGLAAAAVLAAGFGALNAIQVKDAQIDSKGGLMVSGEKGTFQLDKDDSIIAGTDLNKKNGKSGGGASVDMTETNRLLRELLNAVTTEGAVMLDGQKVGTALSLGSYKTQ